MAGLMHRDSQQSRIREHQARIGPECKQDGGLAYPARLIPGKIGLPRTIEIEMIDPAHNDVRGGGVRDESETNTGPHILPAGKRLPNVLSHFRLESSGATLDDRDP